jgi:hypothetical protein
VDWTSLKVNGWSLNSSLELIWPPVTLGRRFTTWMLMGAEFADAPSLSVARAVTE